MDKLKELLQKILGDKVDESLLDEVSGGIAELVETEVEGLKKKRDELLAKNKDLRQKATSAPDLDGEEVEEMRRRLDEYEKSEQERQNEQDKKAQNFDAILERERGKLQKQLDELAENNSRLSEQRNSILVENALSKNFSSVGVDDLYRPDLMDAFRTKASVKDADGELGVVIRSEDGTPLPVDEFFKDWSESDRAKAYITDRATGGGANGSSGPRSTNTYTRQDLQDPEKRKEYFNRKLKGDEVAIQEG